MACPSVTTEDGTGRILQFVSTFSSSRLGSHFQKLSAEEQQEYGRLYLQDFLLLALKIKSHDELRVNGRFLPHMRVKPVFQEQDVIISTVCPGVLQGPVGLRLGAPGLRGRRRGALAGLDSGRWQTVRPATGLSPPHVSAAAPAGCRGRSAGVGGGNP